MPTPSATLLVSVNGGAPTTGGITAAAGDTIQFSFQNTTGWSSNCRLELSFPSGFSLPAGWSSETTDGHTVYYVLGNTTPPVITLGPWGKYMPRLIVNGGAATDESTAISVPSPSGLLDMGHREAGQFGGSAKKWTEDHQANLRTIESTLATVAAIGDVDPTPDTLLLRGPSGEAKAVHVELTASTVSATGHVRGPEGLAIYGRVATGAGEDARVAALDGTTLRVGGSNVSPRIETIENGDVALAHGATPTTFARVRSATACAAPGDMRFDLTTGRLYIYVDGVGEQIVQVGSNYWTTILASQTLLSGTDVPARYWIPGIAVSTSMYRWRVDVACTAVSMRFTCLTAQVSTGTTTVTLCTVDSDVVTDTALTFDVQNGDRQIDVSGSVSLAAGQEITVKVFTTGSVNSTAASNALTIGFDAA